MQGVRNTAPAAQKKHSTHDGSPPNTAPVAQNDTHTLSHACHVICTLSLHDAALTMRFAENTQHTSKVLRVPRKMTSKVLRLPRKNATHLLESTQKYCACRTKRLSTRYETCWTVTKCHACHAKRGYAAFETSKSDHFCRTRHRHGHTGLTRPVASGCGRLRNVWRTQPPPPDPQSETGTRAMHSGKTEVDKGAFWFQDHTTRSVLAFANWTNHAVFF